MLASRAQAPADCTIDHYNGNVPWPAVSERKSPRRPPEVPERHRNPMPRNARVPEQNCCAGAATSAAGRRLQGSRTEAGCRARHPESAIASLRDAATVDSSSRGALTSPVITPERTPPQPRSDAEDERTGYASRMDSTTNAQFLEYAWYIFDD